MGLVDKVDDPYECYKNVPWPTLEYVSREEWGAQPPKAVEPFETFPVKNIILGWTETDRCETKEDCIKVMQELQKKHMDQGEPDIRFSYVVGWDERVYEGRGFKVKAGTNPRYTELKGTNVEVVLSGQRGEIPRPGIKTSIMYQVLDKAQFEGTILFDNARYTLDYDEDPEEDLFILMENKVLEFNRKVRPVLEPFAQEYRRIYANK